ncbi:hypothetical protein T492DRAFT_1047978 [Pavlovales sp. CCMP2436]|nr:hypothetical protein T492DRAFT_1047978 [Pavlovales sp. CCMP2436]
MVIECHELLRLFGVPAVTAPMEAEAQCAALELAGLVDGIATEDSDVLLFGGARIYRHLFDQKRLVELIESRDIAAELGLGREDLVDIALLLGSDYTEGVRGVGIVNATEVADAFRDAETGRIALGSLKAWSEALIDGPDADAEADAAAGGGHVDEAEARRRKQRARRREFVRKHGNIRRVWAFPSEFPSERVRQAYLRPHVEVPQDGDAAFTWRRPDVPGLLAFCADKFGWSQEHTRAQLDPVLEKIDVTDSQQRIDAMFGFDQRFASFRSKRLHGAISGLAGKGAAVHMPPPPGAARKHKSASAEPAADERAKPKAKNKKSPPSHQGCGADGAPATAPVDKPKRTTSSYFLYSAELRAGNTRMSAQECGEAWKALSEAERAVFTERARALRTSAAAAAGSQPPAPQQSTAVGKRPATASELASRQRARRGSDSD